MNTATPSRASLRVQTDKRAIPLWKSLIAEFLGTFFLTLAAVLPGALKQTGVGLNHAELVVPAGLVVGALILAIGNTSGAHFNPVVTTAFTVRGAFPLRYVIPYWLVQIAGALLSSSLVVVVLGKETALMGHPLQYGSLAAFTIETILTLLLITVILGTANKHKLVGSNAAIAVAATISLCGMIGDPISGASMNPARSLGPALVNRDFTDLWIYILGPLVGALLGTGLIALLSGRCNDEEASEAQGRDARKD